MRADSIRLIRSAGAGYTDDARTPALKIADPTAGGRPWPSPILR